MATKRIINADIGKGWHYFEGSEVSELVHSGAVVIETEELRFVYCSGRTATKGDLDEVVAPGDIKEQTDRSYETWAQRLKKHGRDVRPYCAEASVRRAPIHRRELRQDP